jgi:hypothetical protein
MGHVLMRLQAGSVNRTVGCGVQKLYRAKLLPLCYEDQAGKAGKAGKVGKVGKAGKTK